MNKTIKAFAAAQRIIDSVESAGFNLCDYADIKNAIHCGYEYFPEFIHYESGATRLVIWDDQYDYVIKIAIGSDCEKYNQHEAEVYEAAVNAGLEDYFGWCKCYIKSENKPGIYVMEFLDGDEYDITDSAYKYSYENYCNTNGLDASDYEVMEEYDSIERDEREEVENLLESQMSLNEIHDFRIFLIKWFINDLHAGNVLYRNETLVICDYAGFGW